MPCSVFWRPMIRKHGHHGAAGLLLYCIISLWMPYFKYKSDSPLLIYFYLSLLNWEITLWTTQQLYHDLLLQLKVECTLISSYKATYVNREPKEICVGRGRYLYVWKICVCEHLHWPFFFYVFKNLLDATKWLKKYYSKIHYSII